MEKHLPYSHSALVDVGRAVIEACKKYDRYGYKSYHSMLIRKMRNPHIHYKISDPMKPFMKTGYYSAKRLRLDAIKLNMPILPLTPKHIYKRMYPPLPSRNIDHMLWELTTKVLYETYVGNIQINEYPELFMEQIYRYNMTEADIVALWGRPAYHFLGEPSPPYSLADEDFDTYVSLGLNAAEMAAILHLDDSFLNYLLETNDLQLLAHACQLLTVPYDDHPLIYWDGISPRTIPQTRHRFSIDNIGHLREAIYPVHEAITISGHTFPSGRRRSMMELLTDPLIFQALSTHKLAPIPFARLCGANLHNMHTLIHPTLNVVVQRYDRNHKYRDAVSFVKASGLPRSEWSRNLPNVPINLGLKVVSQDYYYPMKDGLYWMGYNLRTYQMGIFTITGSSPRITYGNINEITKYWKNMYKNPNCK